MRIFVIWHLIFYFFIRSFIVLLECYCEIVTRNVDHFEQEFLIQYLSIFRFIECNYKVFYEEGIECDG